MLYFSGCGGGAKVGEDSESKIGVFRQDFGFTAAAHANDAMMLVITNRDACYNMEYELFGNMNDSKFLLKEGAMNVAIMNMVEQLKKEKDPDLELANLENIIDDFDFSADVYGGGEDSFGATLESVSA